MLVVRIGEYKVDGRRMDGILWVGDCCRRGRKGKERKAWQRTAEWYG
jgi:hypothetical protein